MEITTVLWWNLKVAKELDAASHIIQGVKPTPLETFSNKEL